MGWRAVVVAGALAVAGAGCASDPPRIIRPDKPAWCPSNVPTRQAFDARTLLGRSPDAAQREAEDHGCRFRVVKEDGQPQGGTADVRLDRVDAVIEHDVVVEVSIG
jgi:hypothetical protein